MRLILEHPWAASTMIGAVGFGFLWVGARESLIGRMKVGIVILIMALLAFLLGTFIETPTEHARRVVYGFVDAVIEGDIQHSLSYLDEHVLLVDDWKGSSGAGTEAVQESLNELHSRHSLKNNMILRFTPMEREGDVLVELSLFTRVSGIGSVPSRWRLLVHEDQTAVWSIYSIDAIEIAGRTFR